MSPDIQKSLRSVLTLRSLAEVLVAVATLWILFPPVHPQAASRRNAQPASSQAASAPSTSQPQKAVPAKPNRSESAFTVLLDPAHGGADKGAMLAPDQPEKEYTLALATRLQPLMKAKGVHVILTRTSDSALDGNNRAEIANRAQPAACIVLHATSTGEGIHLFTSSLPSSEKQISSGPRRDFLPWKTAQASFEAESLRLESDMNATLTHRHLRVLITRTSMATLNSMACPAVAIEIAPRDAHTPPADPAYEREVSQALVTAVVSWRNEWRRQP